MKEKLQSELYCQWVGLMPVELFFEVFLNTNLKDLKEIPKHPDNYFDDVPHATKEPELYQSFVSVPLILCF